MWHLDQEKQQLYRSAAKDVAHGTLFVVAVAMLIVGGLFTSPADLGLIAAAVGILGLVGIVRA